MEEDADEQRVGFGFVQPRPVRVRDKDSVAAEPAPLRAGFLYYLTTPPYPARGSEAAGAAPQVLGGRFTRQVLDAMTLGGDVASFAVTQVYFPVDEIYRIVGGADHEELALAGDLVGFQLGQTFFPHEYIYISVPGDGSGGSGDAVPHEDLSLGGDLIGFQLGTVYYPVDYPNYPPEFLWLGGDVINFSLETP